MLERYIPKFKQEFFSILFISVLHVWWCFKFPALTRLGFPWDIIIGIFLSIGGIIVYICMFSNTEKFAPVFYLRTFDGIPHEHVAKYSMKIWIIALTLSTMFMLWYKDFYHMPSVYYAMMYTYIMIVYVLLYRATKRMPLDHFNDKNINI